jgi:glycerol uptake facilitator-like aquaporin
VNTFKTVLIFTLLGAILGALVASLVVPPLLGWYNEPGNISPGNQVQTLCNIPELIHYTARRIFIGQAAGAGLGGTLFLMLGVMVARRRSPEPSTAVQPAA